MTTKPRGRNVSTILDDLQRSGASLERAPLPSGFGTLDEALRGGIRPQELTLVGGKPGVGKTIATLQWARRMVLDGAHVVYACYEHSEELLTARLLLMELGSLVRPDHVVGLDRVRAGLADFAAGWRALDELDDERGLLGDAVASMRAYADELWLVPASSRTHGLPELTHLVEQYGNGRTALFVDYLQKVPIQSDVENEAEKVTRVADGLKDLAMSHGCAVVAVSASSTDGLTSHRQRIHHMRGSSALAYEADTVIMLNDKIDAVSKVHLAYDPVKAETFRNLVIFSLEKNRNGRASIDIEYQKDFAHARFVMPGQWVAETLLDDRVVVE